MMTSQKIDYMLFNMLLLINLISCLDYEQKKINSIEFWFIDNLSKLHINIFLILTLDLIVDALILLLLSCFILDHSALKLSKKSVICQEDKQS